MMNNQHQKSMKKIQLQKRKNVDGNIIHLFIIIKI